MGTHRHDEWLSAVDGLLARPFPADGYQSGDEAGGPAHFRLELCRSADFWENRAEEVVEPALAEIEAHADALGEVFTARWGAAEPFAVWPYLEAWPGVRAPEPIGYLCQYLSDISLWRVPETDRWLTLAVCQADPEFPFVLVAAIGRTEVLVPPPDSADRLLRF